jgi:hypothetical protein
MKTAGVVIDNWKLPIFQRHLNEGGFAYTEHTGLTADAMVLKVRTEFISTLQSVIEAAQKECADHAAKNAH